MTVVTNPARVDSIEDFDDASLDESPTETQEGVDYSPTNQEAAVPERLYDNETQSDIVFVAGVNGDTWRYPGHRKVLAATSPVFASLLSGKTDIIRVDYVDRRGFEQLLRYLYCEPLQLNSIATARSALDVAYKFLCPALAEKCVRRLDEILDGSIALEVIKDLRFLCARLPGAASAPPLPAFTDNFSARLLAQCSRWCDSLAHNCLLVLDDNADMALNDERFEELSYEDLALIVKRETFRASSELTLAEALSRWATAACKRTKRELTPANKRAALGELAYCPRYLLLSGEYLDRALALELLEPMERALVIARARRFSAPVPVGAQQEAMLRRWARPRPAQLAALPVSLSARSDAPTPEPEPSKLCARRHRGPKTPSFAIEEKRKKRGCCSSFCEGLLRAFICLFD